MQHEKRPVTVQAAANMNLEQAQRALAQVLGKVGHPGCISGFNINFVNAVDPAPMVLKAEQSGAVA
jgi:hypothetical protein